MRALVILLIAALPAFADDRQDAMRTAGMRIVVAHKCGNDAAYQRALDAAPEILIAGGMTAAEAERWITDAQARLAEQGPFEPMPKPLSVEGLCDLLTAPD